MNINKKFKPIEKTQTQDGIYIPDSIKDKPMHFTV